MKILLIGKNGQLGGDILKNNPGHKIYAPDRKVLDITSSHSVNMAINNYQPDVVINTAAFHNVPGCETNSEEAFKVNCLAVRDLAMTCKKTSSLFVTFSSDYVFSGKKKSPYIEKDRPQPLQIYGISRVAGEYAAMSIYPEKSIIIRTCGLYGISGARSKGGNFVDNRIHDAEKTDSLEISCEQTISPTCTDDLSRAVLQLIEHPRLKNGIYHLVNDGTCTWFEFTETIYKIMKIDIKLIPVDRRGMSGEMRRPLYSALANTRAGEMGIVLPHWRDALERYLKNKYQYKLN